MSEKTIMVAIQLALAPLGVRLLRNNVGLFDLKEGGKIRVGLGTGSSDLVGWVIPSGRFIAVEVKTPTGRATKEQLNFLEAVNKGGGIGFIARSVEEAVEKLKQKL